MIHKIKKKLKDKLTVKEIYTEQIPLLSGKLLEGRTALITGGGVWNWLRNCPGICKSGS